MLNFLVETKNEYTIHLTNILTPLIFEGLTSIYKEAEEVSGTTDILKLFQSFLKRIPKWNQSMIEKETNRIINSTQSYGWLNDLIKATLKSTLIILMYNPTVKTQTKLNPSLYQDIKTEDFIHKVYIECARELWNNPYLLYHNYPPIEIKRNQRDTMNIIKECIKESLRKLLPVKHILQIYLGEEMEVNNIDNNEFEKIMSDVEERNLSKMIQKDLDNVELPKHKPILDTPASSFLSESKEDEIKQNMVNYNLSPDIKEYNNITSEPNNDMTTLNSTKNPKDMGDKILNIINKTQIIKSNKNTNIDNTNIDTNIDTNMDTVIDTNMDTIMDTNVDTNVDTNDTSPLIEENKIQNNNSNAIIPVDESLQPQNNDSIDVRIKQILKRDLASDLVSDSDDIETSLNYSQEDNDGRYREIFSNATNAPQPVQQQSKFFKKYLSL